MKKAINPVVELVKAWEVFENENPTGNLEAFCQDYLRKQQLAKFKRVDEGYLHHNGGREVKPSNGLGKALVRVQKYLHFYIKKTMQNLPIDNIEDFAYLSDLHFMGAMRKSELIHRNISEFTSGTNVINRLIKNQLVEEFNDPDDARSKQVKITQSGVNWIMSCLPDMIKVDSVLFQVLQSDEREVLFHILAKLDRFHTSIYSEMRALEIEDILKKVI
ncbi:hypothetical protein QM480_16220 [Flectobacillus sp. DC10W]|jgi:DNA-binding MarR family transcriptional regulator|uniref:HTH marR-type domain-containing protein n=1 Tax=Flectobacillus longus TaxID=2984207 RepID=A0ABT6YQR6_9BACT|nr:hypothetical protein [Flectobacillus longus]MDI9865890.1 hypothetical protein [Flectobacillus longus]